MFYKRDWLIFFVITVLIFLAAGRTAIDSDLWWHLRAGEETISQGYPLLEDHFSVTRIGTGWVNHSWLSQVILYLVDKMAGFMGISLVIATTATLSMALVFLQMSGKPIIRAFLLILGAMVAATVWSARPQIFSLALFSLTSLILFLFKWKQNNYLGWLPIIFILWSNLHGGYPLGLILIGVTIVGELVNRWLQIDLSRELSWKEIRLLVIVGAASALAVVINPNGINMWLIPFQTVEVKAVQQLIQEWASPDFHELFQQPFLWLLMATIAAFALSGRKADAGDVLAVVVFGFMGLTSRRNFGPFALAATPILSRYAWLAWKSLRDGKTQLNSGIETELPGRFIPRWQKGINLSLVGILFFTSLGKGYVVNRPEFIEQVIQTSYPAGAVAWIEENKPEGQMLNEYNWGGYLSWMLRDYRIFIDGRTDLYGDCGINEWIHLVQAGEFWREILDGYEIGFVLLEPNRPIVGVLMDNGWKKVYTDSLSVVVVRSAP